MKFIDRIAGTPKARKQYRDAKQHLADVSRRGGADTNDYLAAHDAVIDAEQNLPKWRRYPIGPDA